MIPFTKIQDIDQYYEYCHLLEWMVFNDSNLYEEKINEITSLIEEYDAKSFTL